MTNFAVVQPGDPAYLRAAFSKLGLSEIQGPKHEKQVLAMYLACGHPEIHDDETAWCAAFVGWCLDKGNLPNTRSLLAISYAKYGTALDRSRILPRGAIAVWHRDGGNHVNFVLHDDGVTLTLLGGNQSNGRGGGVTISKRRKDEAIAFRAPAGIAAPKDKPQKIADTETEDADPRDTDATDEKTETSVVSVDGSSNTKSDEIQASAARDVEPRVSWVKRKWVALTSWSGGLLGGGGLMAWLAEPKTLLWIGVLCLAAFVVFLAVVGPGWARAWLRKQVS